MQALSLPSSAFESEIVCFCPCCASLSVDWKATGDEGRVAEAHMLVLWAAGREVLQVRACNNIVAPALAHVVADVYAALHVVRCLRWGFEHLLV